MEKLDNLAEQLSEASVPREFFGIPAIYTDFIWSDPSLFDNTISIIRDSINKMNNDTKNNQHLTQQ